MLGLGRESAEDSLLPDVIAERCVHSRMEQASCRACVEACPSRAWVIDDERLGIDPDRCDGCGLCAPACPQGAIAERFAPARYRVDGTDIAFAACSRAVANGSGDGVLPCLHVLGVGALLRLHGNGVRRLVLCRGDCGSCPRGGVTRIDTCLDRASALLSDRGLDPILHQDLAAARWADALAAAQARHRTATLGRRAFFRGVLTAAADAANDLSNRSPSGVPEFVPPGRLLPPRDGACLSLHAPYIDARKCNGCDACARLCPQEVIRVEPEAYRLDPDGCTGCGICVDGCASGAVSLRVLDSSPQRSLALRRGRCRGCGVDFHRPGSHAERQDLCPVCAVSPHYRRNFQVLD